jgi:hypothetical protein
MSENIFQQRTHVNIIGNSSTNQDNLELTNHETLNAGGTEGELLTSNLSNYSDISDIVNIDSYGRGHITSNSLNGRSRSGQFISSQEMEQIVTNQNLIRASRQENSTGPVANIDEQITDEGIKNELNVEFMRDFPIAEAYKLATALNNWTKLAARRERSIITTGDLTAKHVEAARRRYEQLRRQANAWTIGKLGELGVELSGVLMVSEQEDKTEARLAGQAIKFEAERLAANVKGPLAEARKDFYNWWANQGGGDKFFSRQRLTGTAKKAAVMGAVGLPIGFVAGTAGIFLAGPIAGAAVAAGISRGVARGLLRKHIEKHTHAKSVATYQFEKRLTDQYQKIEKAYTIKDESRDIPYLPYTVTDSYAEGTMKNVRRNRRRLMGSVVIGAAFGTGGAFLGELAHNALWGNSHKPTAVKPPVVHHPVTHHHPVKHHGQTSSPRPPAVKPKPPVQHHPVTLHGPTGQEFYVTPGGGEISEIQAYAASHNYHVTPGQAYQIYLELYDQHGANIIKLAGSGPSTYVIRPGDVGLSHPGEARWYPGIESELRNYLATITT